MKPSCEQILEYAKEYSKKDFYLIHRSDAIPVIEQENMMYPEEGDIVEITNIYGQKYTYVVYEKYYINPEQTEVLKNTSESIVTMITCNNTSSKRLIVRARLQ